LIKGRKKNVGLVACKPTFIEDIPAGSLICVEFVVLKLSNRNLLFAHIYATAGCDGADLLRVLQLYTTDLHLNLLL
jgi:hypothetical protein